MQIRGVERRTVAGREDQVEVLTEVAEFEAFGVLARPVCLQCGDGG